MTNHLASDNVRVATALDAYLAACAEARALGFAEVDIEAVTATERDALNAARRDREHNRHQRKFGALLGWV